MMFQTSPVGRTAVLGLVLSSALLSAANPIYRNQFGEECDKNGVPIKKSGYHGDSYNGDRDLDFDDGTKNYNGDSGNKDHYGGSYDDGNDNYFDDGKDRQYDGRPVSYRPDDHGYDNYEDKDYDHGYDGYDSNDYDNDYNYDDAPHPYDTDDDYYDDGNIIFNIDRDRDGRFNSGYSDYPYINTHRTKVPYGEIIHSCTEPNTIALTFHGGLAGYNDDDEHAGRTIEVLDYLHDNQMVGTFFITGNKRFTNNVDVLHRMVDDGHQIGHNTLSHKDLTDISRDDVYREMNDLEYLFRDHLGYSPTYMRQPYLASNDEVLNILDELKYHVIGVDVDTKDWQYHNEDDIDTSVHNFNTGFNDGHRLVMAHDTHEWLVKKLLPEMHKAITEGNIRTVTVGECLGDPRENWYRRVHD